MEVFYAQCFSLVDYLIGRRGLPTFLKFLDELALSPRSLALLLDRHYRIDGPAAFERLWRGELERTIR